jgi:hypothetical protein
LNKPDEAKEALARALLRFPTVLKPLLEKVAVNTSSGTSIQMRPPAVTAILSLMCL